MAADRSQEMPAAVRDVLVRVRRQIRFRILIDGLLVAALCILILFWLGAAVDYLPVTVGSNETPRWLRAGLLGLMGLGLAWALVWRMARSYFARMSDRNLAVLLERHYPQLNSELVTVVELAHQAPEEVSNPAAYRAMLSRVQQSAAQHMTALDTSGLLNWRPVWWFSWSAGLLLLMTLGIAVAKPAWISLWSARLFALSEQRWPRLAHLELDGVQLQLPTFTGQLAADRLNVPFVDKIVHVPRGGAVILNAKADTQAALVPELCTLFYQQADGSRGRANLRRLGVPTNGWQSFMLDGPPLVDIESDMTFDIVGGDARLDDFFLKAVDPAVVKSIKLDLSYPNYLLAARTSLPAHEQLEYRTGQRIPEGTQVVLHGSASGPLKSVQYVIRSIGGASPNKANAGSSRATSAPSSAASSADTPINPSELAVQTVAPRGQDFELPLGVLSESAVVEIRLIDEFGLTSDQIPRYVLSVTEDTVPEVEAKLVGIGTAITPKAILPMTGKAGDDHGLSRVWATVVVNEQPPVEIEVEVDSGGNFKPRIDLMALAESGKLKVTEDATLGLALSALDHFDLAGIKHTGHGQPIQLGVVSEDKLQVMIDRQELELRQRLELIISELTQLHDVLREQSVRGGNSAAVRREPRAHLVSSLISQPPNGDAATGSAAADDKADSAEPAPDPEQLRRIMLLRAQQSVMQGDKSHQELVGVAGLVNDIRLQLINNRIDSTDRQARLNEKVYVPLQSVVTGDMQSLRSRLVQFQTAAMSPEGGRAQAAMAAEDNERVIAALKTIVANMSELAAFNEFVDEIRGLRDQQQELLKATKAKQRADMLESLK